MGYGGRTNGQPGKENAVSGSHAIQSVEHLSHTGSQPQRESHVICAPLLSFDMAQEEARLAREPAYLKGDRNAKTLVKSGHHRLVLAMPKAGVTLDEDDPEGYVSLLVQRGRIWVDVEGERSEIAAGQVAAIEAGHTWSAQAMEDSVVLMNFSWPESPTSLDGR